MTETVVGTAVVQIQGRDNQLAQVLARDHEAVKRFEEAVNRFAAAAGTKFGTAVRKGKEEASSFEKVLQRTTAALGLIPGPAGAAASRMSSFLTTVGGLGPVATTAGLGIGALVLALNESIKASAEFERLSFQTEAMLKATGYAAGVTGAQIRELAYDIDEATLASAHGVENAAQALVQFGSVSGEQFTETLRLAQDLAASGFGSVESAATAMGIAFERPEAAARRFRRIGLHEVVFLQAKAFKEMGEQAKANQVILDAVREKVGGTGVAEGQGLAGAYDALGDSYERWLTQIGDSGPLKFHTDAMNRIAEASERIRKSLFGDSIKVPAGISPDDAKKKAEEAKAKRLADDARATALKKAEKDREEAATEAKRLAQQEADQAKQLRKQRDDTIDGLIYETESLEKLIPKLLQSGMASDEVNKALAEEAQLLGTLTQLELDRNSAQGQAIEQERKRQAAIRQTLTDETARRDALSTSEEAIAALERETEALGMTTQAAAEAAHRIELLNKVQSGVKLTAEEVDRLAEAFGRASASKDMADLLTGLSTDVSHSERELDILAATFNKTTAEAASFRFEQEALAQAMLIADHVSDHETHEIHRLAEAYGAAAQAMEKLQDRRQVQEFASGELLSLLDQLEDGTKSVGQAFEDLAVSIAKAVEQGVLFGQGPLAGVLGTRDSGGIIGGAIGKLLTPKKEENPLEGIEDSIEITPSKIGDIAGDAEQGAEIAALTTAATGLTTAATSLTGAGTGLAASATGMSGAATTIGGAGTSLTTAGVSLGTAGTGLGTAAAALTEAAVALSAAAGAGAAGGAAAVAGAAGAAAGVMHEGGIVGSGSYPRRMVRTSLSLPRYHQGLRAGEALTILEDGEGVIPKDLMRKGRRGDRGGDTYIMNNNGVENHDGFQRGASQTFAQFADTVSIAKRRNG